MKERTVLVIGTLAGLLAGWMVVAAAWVHFQVWVILTISLPLMLCLMGARSLRTILSSATCFLAVIQANTIRANIVHKYYEAYGLRWTDVFGTLSLWAITLGVMTGIWFAVRSLWPAKATQ